MRNALMTLAAVLALTGLNWWLGRSGRLARDPGGASARLREDLIDFLERDGDDANAGRAHVALGAASDDLTVAIARGDGWVTRRLRPGTLREVTRNGTRLDLRCRDFTLPTIVLIFADAERAAPAGTWRDRLWFMVAPPGWSPDGSRDTTDMIKAKWRRATPSPDDGRSPAA